MLKSVNSVINASQITGTLPVSNGGTGATSLTDNRLAKGNGTSAFSASNVYDDGTNSGVASGNFIIDAGSIQTKYISSISLANALNDNLAVPAGAGFITFTGGGASAQLGGMTAGSDGQRMTILNATGGAITIVGESGTSTAANRIWTQGLTPFAWANLGTLDFIYSSQQSRWLMIGSL